MLDGLSALVATVSDFLTVGFSLESQAHGEKIAHRGYQGIRYTNSKHGSRLDVRTVIPYDVARSPI